MWSHSTPRSLHCPLCRLICDAESLRWLGGPQLCQAGLPQCGPVRERPAGDQSGRGLGLLQTLSLGRHWPGHPGGLGEAQPGAHHQGLGLQRLEHHQHCSGHLQVSGGQQSAVSSQLLIFLVLSWRETPKAAREPALSLKVEWLWWELRTISTAWRCRPPWVAQWRWRSSVRTIRSCWWSPRYRRTLAATRRTDTTWRLLNINIYWHLIIKHQKYISQYLYHIFSCQVQFLASWHWKQISTYNISWKLERRWKPGFHWNSAENRNNIGNMF